jgi:hypothetical protein
MVDQVLQVKVSLVALIRQTLLMQVVVEVQLVQD